MAGQLAGSTDAGLHPRADQSPGLHLMGGTTDRVTISSSRASACGDDRPRRAERHGRPRRPRARWLGPPARRRPSRPAGHARRAAAACRWLRSPWCCGGRRSAGSVATFTMYGTPESKARRSAGPISVRRGDQLAAAAERGHHLVVAALRLQLGGHVVAVEQLHRVLLQPPDAVVAADHHDRQAVPDQRVDVHQREPGRAVAEQQHHLRGRAGPGGPRWRSRGRCRGSRTGPGRASCRAACGSRYLPA